MATHEAAATQQTMLATESNNNNNTNTNTTNALLSPSPRNARRTQLPFVCTPHTAAKPATHQAPPDAQAQAQAQESPRAAPPMCVLAHSCVARGEFESAFEFYQHMASNSETCFDGSLWLDIAQMYVAWGDVKQAISIYTNLVKHHAQEFHVFSRACYNLGVLSRQVGKFSRALQCFERIRKNPPPPLGQPDIAMEISLTYECDSQLDKAILALCAIPNPGVDVLVRLGWLNAQSTNEPQRKAGILMLEGAVAQDPKHDDAWFRLGRVHSHEPLIAFKAIASALRLRPDCVAYWCEMGCLYANEGQFYDAYMCFSRAQVLDKRHGESTFNIGLLFEQTGQHLHAREMYAKSNLLCSHPIIEARCVASSGRNFEENLMGMTPARPLNVEVCNPLSRVRSIIRPRLIVSSRFPDYTTSLI